MKKEYKEIVIKKKIQPVRRSILLAPDVDAYVLKVMGETGQTRGHIINAYLRAFLRACIKNTGL